MNSPRRKRKTFPATCRCTLWYPWQMTTRWTTLRGPSGTTRTILLPPLITRSSLKDAWFSVESIRRRELAMNYGCSNLITWQTRRMYTTPKVSICTCNLLTRFTWRSRRWSLWDRLPFQGTGTRHVCSKNAIWPYMAEGMITLWVKLRSLCLTICISTTSVNYSLFINFL